MISVTGKKKTNREKEIGERAGNTSGIYKEKQSTEMHVIHTFYICCYGFRNEG